MVSCRCCCLFALALLLLFLLLSRDAASVPPLSAPLFEAHLGCPSPSLAAPSLAPLTALHLASDKPPVRSAGLTAARRRFKSVRKLPRVQIANGTLYASCPADDGCASIEHELRTLQLLLRVSRVGDADFFFDASERPCYVSGKARKKNDGDEIVTRVPVVTRETADGCDLNILSPPRALAALPDGARWLARADADPAAWAAARRNLVVWRGGATARTGMFAADGVTPRSVRAKAVALSMARPDLLDARFAGRNDDLQLSKKERAAVRELGWMAADGKGFLTWRQLETYRASLVLDGNTLPDRLPFSLFTMTAVLKQESPLREAWYSLLKPYVHYIPVKHDLSDLESQLQWALSNATRLHTIAANGAKLAMRHLSRRGQLCHWSSLLQSLSEHTARPIVLERNAKRVEGGGSMLFGGRVLHNPLASALRPQLTGRPPSWRDLEAVRYLRIAPCVEGARGHLCLDV